MLLKTVLKAKTTAELVLASLVAFAVPLRWAAVTVSEPFLNEPMRHWVSAPHACALMAGSAHGKNV